MLDVESFQSDPDCKKFMPSLCIEPDLAFQIIHRFGLDPNNFFPILQVRTEQAVVFRGPALGSVSQSAPTRFKIFHSGTISSGSVTGSREFWLR